MKYLLSVWADENFAVLQVNGTAYDRDGNQIAVKTWTPESASLAAALYEIADAMAHTIEQPQLFEESL